MHSVGLGHVEVQQQLFMPRSLGIGPLRNILRILLLLQ